MLTPIRTYNNVDQAYMVRGLLASEGITAEVQDAGPNSVFPSLDDNEGYATIYVDASQVEAADEILRRQGE